MEIGLQVPDFTWPNGATALGPELAEVARTADRLRQESEAAAEEAKLRAATDIQRQRDQAAQEIARLDKVQADVRTELGRLNDVLSNELAAGSRSGGVPAQRNGQPSPGNGNNGGSHHRRPGANAKGREESVGAGN